MPPGWRNFEGLVRMSSAFLQIRWLGSPGFKKMRLFLSVSSPISKEKSQCSTVSMRMPPKTSMQIA